MPAPIKVFVSYAHQDAALKDRLLQHLASLVREGLIEVWHDREIDAGAAWAARIDNEIERAGLVLLLVSPAFMASDYCQGVELQRALDRAAAGQARVVPVILQPVDWQTSAFASLQALPADGRPVTSWPDADEALLDVALGLRKAVASQHAASARDAAAAAPARYYLYISDAKLDMLYPQVPPPLRGEVPATPGARHEDTRVQRLEAVLRHLAQAGRTGSVQAPLDYIAGTHELRWGSVHRGLVQRDRERSVVLFSGEVEGTTLVMCGSSRHLIGWRRPRDTGFSSSLLPHVIESLLGEVELAGRPVSELALEGRAGSRVSQALPYSGNELALELVAQAPMNMRGVTQKLEFMARTLLAGTSPRWGARCLLASPLYVALAF